MNGASSGSVDSLATLLRRILSDVIDRTSILLRRCVLPWNEPRGSECGFGGACDCCADAYD